MTPDASRHRRRIGGLLASGRLPFDYKPESSMKRSKEIAEHIKAAGDGKAVTLAETVAASGGPFFSARWRPEPDWQREWAEETYRLFRDAKNRIDEEYHKGKAHMAYVQCLLTDEVVYSVGPPEDDWNRILTKTIKDSTRLTATEILASMASENAARTYALGSKADANKVASAPELQRVRELGRALEATGYFRNPGEYGPASHFHNWLENVQYLEAVDASLDGLVPSQKDGKPIWLKERVAMLLDLCIKQAKELKGEKGKAADHKA